ncbi:MAG: ABC transporter permease subunit [Chloroflexi bacterium]|nr:ABC transporter permease subunit [Chloroflexota bacterium]
MNMFFPQLRNELRKLFGKKRTYIGFLMFLLAQNVIVVLFRFTNGPRVSMQRTLEGNGYLAEQFISGLTVATFMLFPIAYILMPLYVSLVGGDLVAKEAEDGTLRMILSRPISRLRLLLVKWLAGVVFSAMLVLALGVFGLAFASVWFPWGGLFVFVPGELFGVFEALNGCRQYLLAHLVMVTKASTVMGLAFMFSCFNVKPAAATILALSFVFVNFIMQNIPYFQELQHWFLTYHLNVWQSMFAQPVPWWKLGQSLSILLGFNLTFLVVGATVFQMRDIKS